MRRDWDFVAMSDYQADMEESAQTALNAITYMRTRMEQAERALAEVLLEIGKTVEVSARHLHDPTRKIEMLVERNERNDTICFMARRS